MPLVCRFVLIDVNPYVDVTTGKMNPYKAAIFCLCRGGELSIAGKIKISA
jgi:hypothetical protein